MKNPFISTESKARRFIRAWILDPIFIGIGIVLITGLLFASMAGCRYLMIDTVREIRK